MRAGDYIRVSEAASLLRVTPQTIRKYAREGRLTDTVRTPGGQVLYNKAEILRVMGADDRTAPVNQGPLVFYVRASDGDKVKLESQVAQLTGEYGAPVRVYSDKASGLNENRKGLTRLIEDARTGKIGTVAITQKDRLTRFGYSYLEQLLGMSGVRVLVAFDQPEKSLQEELMQDFMSLIASFSGKYYRLRGYEQQTRFMNEAEARFDKKLKDHAE